MKVVPITVLVVLAVTLVLGIALSALDASDNLRVEYLNKVLKVQNVGQDPIEIKKIVVNERSDCIVLNMTPAGATLKVGDTQLFLSTCNVVRVTISSSKGELTYTF